MVLVQFRVRVPDVERFKATQEKYLPVMEELGGKNHRAYYAASDPQEVTTFSASPSWPIQPIQAFITMACSSSPSGMWPPL